MTQVTRNGFVDKNGKKVQLLPAPHEHTISDVKGLNNALIDLSDNFETLDNNKQNKLTFDETPTAGSTNPVTSGGLKAALSNLTPYRMVDAEGECEIYLYGHDGALLKAPTIDLRIGSEQADVTPAALANLKRAMVGPDTTPTANSDNIVTSGGVKAALDSNAPEVIFAEGEDITLYLPNYFAHGERQRSFLLNYQGDIVDLSNLFLVDTNDIIRILSDSTIMVGSCYFAVRVIKQPGGVAQGDVYYIIFDGKVEY